MNNSDSPNNVLYNYYNIIFRIRERTFSQLKLMEVSQGLITLILI